MWAASLWSGSCKRYTYFVAGLPRSLLCLLAMLEADTVKLHNLFREKGVNAIIKINDNFRTYLSISRGVSLRISLHRIFLSAPDDVLDALVSYAQGDKKSQRVLQSYITKEKVHLDYSNRVDPEAFDVKGVVHNLQDIYDTINTTHFDSALKLSITYFEGKRNASRCATLGSYCDTRKLIKIHKKLDTNTVPRYVVEYIVYHEMLHAIFPEQCDAQGRRRSHHVEFKRQERKFPHFLLAKLWIKDNLKNMLATYGWTQ